MRVPKGIGNVNRKPVLRLLLLISAWTWASVCDPATEPAPKCVARRVPMSMSTAGDAAAS